MQRCPNERAVPGGFALLLSCFTFVWPLHKLGMLLLWKELGFEVLQPEILASTLGPLPSPRRGLRCGRGAWQGV
jgi:hypothetical protein